MNKETGEIENLSDKNPKFRHCGKKRNTAKKAVISCVMAVFLSLQLGKAQHLPIFQSSVAVFTDISEQKAVPVGKSIGITLSIDGVLVVNTAEIETKNGKMLSPALNAGIKSGDLIKKYNGACVSNVEDLFDEIKKAEGKEAPVTLSRNGKIIETLVEPQLSKGDGEYRIGVWVKDAASGIGTMTFYIPESKTFGALGHGICDVETGKTLEIDSGDVLGSTVVCVNKGERGVPGELKGVFTEGEKHLGEIEKNTGCGVFGTLEEGSFATENAISLAPKSEVHTGKAHILANVEGSKVESFEIEIQRVMPQGYPSPKGMVIKITDNKLLEKTGGIVQGMSGCPIIQDNKLIGAVTHVFVNDPTRGYGIFIENMIKNIG